MQIEKRVAQSSFFVEQAVALLRMEAAAIAQAAERMNAESLAAALRLLSTNHGKVVVTGVGKSGIIAKKIAATMTSTGTAAVFLHPSDALHGDLGIVTPQDVAIALSNSGETDELLAMLPFLKHRHVPLIAIVGNRESTLGRTATVVLDASVDREACPFNLAPTTSTSVALAIGDALAMTLMQMKEQTPEDFAINHPAGRLGKRLTLRVRDLMAAATQQVFVAPEAPWLHVVTALTAGGLGAVTVVDGTGKLIGLITDGDLRRALQAITADTLDSLSARTIMTHSPVTVPPDMLAYEALQLMENRPSQISVLPVVDPDGRNLGVIRLHDLIRGGLA